MIPEPAWVWPALFLTGLMAGWVDSIAGGGGLITLPVLLSLGLPPARALGTNKLQAVFGSGGAAWHFGREGLIPWRRCLGGVAWTAVGASGGTMAARWIGPDALRMVIPFLLMGVALFFLLFPRLGHADHPPRMSLAAFHCLAGLAIGFYDGFLGPGTGTFWAFAYVWLLGHNLARSTAHTKLMNFTSNAVSLAVFAAGGHVLLLPGLTMGLGQLLGARLGAHMVVQRGARMVRPVLVCVTLAIAARLVWQNYAGARDRSNTKPDLPSLSVVHSSPRAGLGRRRPRI